MIMKRKSRGQGPKGAVEPVEKKKFRYFVISRMDVGD
jgi:hypothetical protein